VAEFFRYGLARTNSTDAHFRAWVTFIHESMVAGGWVNTSDTGQLDIPTASKPVSSNEQVGYKIYRMSDALQATKPIYVKFAFGSNSANIPAVWQTIGSGSNGSGSITGTIFSASQPGGRIGSGGGLDFGSSAVTRAFDSNTAEDTTSIAGVGSNYCGFSMLYTASGVGFTFAIERGRNEDGSLDGDRIVFISNAGFAPLQRMTSGDHGTSSRNMTDNSQIPFTRMPYTQPAEDVKVGVGYIFPANYDRELQPPMRSFTVVPSASMANFGYLDVRWGDETIRYRHLGYVSLMGWWASDSSNSRVLMRVS
jgi:hypothetical protein